MLESIRGSVKIWIYEGTDYKTYSICISNKDKNGEYTNMYIPVKFSKKVNVNEIVNGCEFKITESWLTFYTKKSTEENVVQLFINDGSVIQEKPATARENKSQSTYSYKNKGGNAK
jgi:hypothetical protein